MSLASAALLFPMYYCEHNPRNEKAGKALENAMFHELIRASLSEPHTSGTALRKCVCIILVCLRPYTMNVKCVFKYFSNIERPRARTVVGEG